MWNPIASSISSGLEGAAARLTKLSARVKATTPIDQTGEIIAASAAIRLELRKLERQARCDLRRYNEERRIREKAAAKYASDEARAAAERDAAISRARMTALVGA